MKCYGTIGKAQGAELHQLKDLNIGLETCQNCSLGLNK